MQHASLQIFNDSSAKDIDPRLYGAFIEHFGRAIYSGIYEPGHPSADEGGLRSDVAGLVREIDVPVVRYPGGNFVSSYRWEDGVGPRELRPKRLSPAWRTCESNQFGTDDFVRWCRTVGTSPMLAFNLGTRGVQAALDLVEYCNHPGGTALSDLRIQNGSREPHDVRVWCLGNEMDCPCQVGNKPAIEYGRLAGETGRALRRLDPTLELVLCGSTRRAMPTYMEWEQTVLEEAYDVVDYISLHYYVAEVDCSSDEEYLATPLTMDLQIREVIAACDFIKAKGGHAKTMMLSFDEWNVWNYIRANSKCEPWSDAPAQLEQEYTMKDALVFAGMLLTLIRHSNRIRIACIAQLVNVIAPIMAIAGGGAWRQTIFFPLLHASRHGRGLLLETRLKCDVSKSRESADVPNIDAVATHDPRDQSVTIFALNRSPADCAFHARTENGAWRVEQHIVLHHFDLSAINSSAEPGNVLPSAGDASVDQGMVHAVLLGYSWNVIRLLPF